MMKKILISILCLAFAGSAAYVVYMLTMAQTGESISAQTQWSTYSDARYGYVISYPTGLIVTQKQSQDIQLSNELGGGYRHVDGGIAARDQYDFGIIDITVIEHVSYASVEEWLQKESDISRAAGVRHIVGNRMRIGNQDALVMHDQNTNTGEANPNEKLVVFIKDENLFEIRTRFVNPSDHERVWHSFRFGK